MATEEQLTPDERAIFAELEKLRGVSDKALFHDFLRWRPSKELFHDFLRGPSQLNFKVAAERLAKYFNLTKSGGSLLQVLSFSTSDHSSLEALSLVYGPEPQNSGSLGGHRFRLREDDYNHVMPRLREQIKIFADESLNAEKRKLSDLRNQLNAEGVAGRLAMAARKIDVEAGGLLLSELDLRVAQATRVVEMMGNKGGVKLKTPSETITDLAKLYHPRTRLGAPRLAFLHYPDNDALVPLFDTYSMLQDLANPTEQITELTKLFKESKNAAYARIGPFVRKEPLLAILFEHPENDALGVPLGGLSILQAYAREVPAATSIGTASGKSAELQLPQKVSHGGTSLATALVGHAIDALDEFQKDLDKNKDHVLRYPPFVLGGIQRAGLSKVVDFREFALEDSEIQSRGIGDIVQFSAGHAIACLGLVFTGPIGMAVLVGAGLTLSFEGYRLAYLQDHEQELAYTAGAFRGQAEQWAEPSGYEGTAMAIMNVGLSIAFALLGGVAAYARAVEAEALKKVLAATREGGAGKARPPRLALKQGASSAPPASASAAGTRPPASGSQSATGPLTWRPSVSSGTRPSASGPQSASPDQRGIALQSKATSLQSKATSPQSKATQSQVTTPPPDTRQRTLELEEAQQRYDLLREQASQAETDYARRLRPKVNAMLRRGKQPTQQATDQLATKAALQKATKEAHAKLKQAEEKLRAQRPREGVAKYREEGLAQERIYRDEQPRNLRVQLTPPGTPVIDAALVGTPEVHSVKSIVPREGSEVAVRLAENGSPRDLADRVRTHITNVLKDRTSDKWNRLRNRWNNTMRESHEGKFGYELPENPDDIRFILEVRVVTARAPSATAREAVEAAVTAWLEKNETVPPRFAWRIMYVKQ